MDGGLSQNILTPLSNVLTSNNKHDWTPKKYLNILHHNRSTLDIWTYLATSIKNDNVNL